PALVLELKSDAGNGELEVVSIDQVVNFTVIGNDDQDYTSLANILVNDVEIEGSSYTFAELGNYQVKAIYDDVVSNVLTFEVLAETERALTVSVTKAMRNQTVTFGLLDNEGTDTSDEATFYVNNTAIEGNTYSSNNIGDFEVYAEYVVNNETYTSATKNFAVYIPKR